MIARTNFIETIGSNTRKVPADQVIVLRSDCKYVIAVHPGGELILSETLKDLEKEFGDRFVRTHRSCLGKPIRADDGRYAHIEVKGLAEPVPLSKRHAKAICKLVAGNE